jgi:glycosyltransferase involved in cell wall biosynthesis
VAIVHSNTSVVLGGASAARLTGVPHVWHVREIYARYGAVWPAHRRLLGSAAALPCVSNATAAQFGAVGFRADVENVYGAADLVAIPSTAPDPLPGAAIEAAAAGCAVLAAGHGGLPEIIRDGTTGRLFDPGDVSALARVAAELLDEPLIRGALGAAAADDVRRRFAPELLTERIGALYETVLAARR